MDRAAGATPTHAQRAALPSTRLAGAPACGPYYPLLSSCSHFNRTAAAPARAIAHTLAGSGAGARGTHAAVRSYCDSATPTLAGALAPS